MSFGLSRLLHENPGKAKEAIDKFVEYCRRIGGRRAEVKENAREYRVSCFFSSPKDLSVSLDTRDGLVINEITWNEWTRFDPVFPEMTVTAYSGNQEGKIGTAGVNLKEEAKGGGLTGSFKKMELTASKDGKYLSLWLGAYRE